MTLCYIIILPYTPHVAFACVPKPQRWQSQYIIMADYGKPGILSYIWYDKTGLTWLEIQTNKKAIMVLIDFK